MGCGRNLGPVIRNTSPDECNEICLNNSSCKQFSVRSFPGPTFNCMLWKAECSKYRLVPSSSEQYYNPQEPKDTTVNPVVPYTLYLQMWNTI